MTRRRTTPAVLGGALGLMVLAALAAALAAVAGASMLAMAIGMTAGAALALTAWAEIRRPALSASRG